MKKLFSIIFYCIIFFVCSNNVNASTMNISSHTAMNNGIIIDVNGNVSSIKDVTDSKNLSIKVKAPSNIPNEQFYNMMLKETIRWRTDSKMIVSKGKLVNALKAPNGTYPAYTRKAFDIKSGLPTFRLTNVSSTYSDKKLDLIVKVDSIKGAKKSSNT